MDSEGGSRKKLVPPRREAGFSSAGVDVLLTGPLPTPGVAYLTRTQRASLGVVISASHNPYQDNGIKFFSAQGTKLDDAWETAVEAALQQPPAWVDSANLGKARRLNDAAGRYIEFCKSTFASDLTLKGLKLVVDAAHGAAYQIAPEVFHELGAEVIKQLQLQAVPNLHPGSVRLVVNDSQIEDLVEHRLQTMANRLLNQPEAWREQSAFFRQPLAQRDGQVQDVSERVAYDPNPDEDSNA